MDDSSANLDDGILVSSVLGVKASIRFHTHKSTQKPHVVLRRVEASEDSSDEEDNDATSSIVRFKLVAHKRFTITPGKEILLAVEDERFKDRAVYISGTPSTVDDVLNTKEKGTEDDIPPLPKPGLPPKMRRAWTKKSEEPANSAIAVRTEVGVQATPSTSSTSVQVKPLLCSVSTQSEASTTSASVQTEDLTSHVPLRADPTPLMNEHKAPESHHAKEKERSLSPMDLDSPDTSSPPYPPFSPGSRSSLSGASFSKLSPSESSDDDDDMQISPDVPVAGLSALLLEPAQSMVTSASSPRESKTEGSVRDSMSFNDQSRASSTTPLDPVPSITSITTSGAEFVKSKSLKKRSAKSPIHNPFVSAGFVTEFTGESRAMKEDESNPETVEPEDVKPVIESESDMKPMITADERATMSATKSEPGAEVTRSRALRRSRVSELFAQSALSVESPAPAASLASGSQASTNEVVKANDVVTPEQSKVWKSNGVTSTSSKVLSEAVSAPKMTKSIPTGPRNAVASSSRNMLPERAAAGDHMKTNPPRAPRSLRELEESAPDPKSLAVVSSGPYSNSLRIKPSTLAAPVPSESKSTTGTQPKKRVVIGAGWPFVKAVADCIPSTISTASHAQSGKGSDLVTYPTSPSPSSHPHTPPAPSSAPPPVPTPPPPPPVQIKWKRLSPINTNVLPSNTGESLLQRISPTNTKKAPAAPGETESPSLLSRMQIPQDSPTSLTVSKKVSQAQPAVSPTDSTVSNGANSSSPTFTPHSLRRPRLDRHRYSKNTDTSEPSPQTSRAAVTSSRSSSDIQSTPSSPDIQATPSSPGSTTVSNGLKSSLSAPSVLTAPGHDTTVPAAVPDKADPPVAKALETPKERDPVPRATQHAPGLGPDPVKESDPAPAPPVPPASSTSQSLKHPLPAKPPVPNRGVKRERPVSPTSPNEGMRTGKSKRTFRWPTLESNHSIHLRGEGNLSILGLAFSSDGAYLALNCADKTTRIWNSQTRTEMARLSHNARVSSVLWIEGDSGVLSLGEDGMVSKWTRTGINHWQWAKVIDIGIKPNYADEDSGMRLAYGKDRIAVSLPSTGVRIWFWVKGSWQLQRPIFRENVTALTFIEDGNALLGGTIDGVLWACDVPNGTLRACAFLNTKILSIDVNPAKTHALVSQIGGVARLVSLQTGKKGQLVQTYQNKDATVDSADFGGLFTAQGQGILFGDFRGCALIWDTRKGSLVYGLDHGVGEAEFGEDESVTAAVSLEGAGGCIVTGTKSGLLSWWSQPAYTNPDSNKKTRVS